MFGLQSWTIRDYFQADPKLAMNQTQGYDFLELGGTGDLTCERLATLLEDTHKSRILGAHICHVGTDTDQVREIVRDYLISFPRLEWLTFFMNPADTQRFASNTQRKHVFENYRAILNNYKLIIKSVYAELNGKDDPFCPQILYHTYPLDFFPDKSGEPMFATLSNLVEIQLDWHFANIVGFDLVNWLDEKNPGYVHSIHLSGTTPDWKHREIRSDDEAQVFNLIKTLKNCGISRYIIEHEINPKSEIEAIKSLGILKQIVQNGEITP